MLFVADAKAQYVLLPMTIKPSAFSLSAQDRIIPLLDQAAAAARQRAAGGSDPGLASCCTRRPPRQTGQHRSAHDRRRFPDRHHFADLVLVPLAASHLPDPAVDRDRLPRRAVLVLAAVRANPPAHAGLWRQPDRRGPGLRPVLPVQPPGGRSRPYLRGAAAASCCRAWA
ncbi:hypothetical protein LP419_36630 [Massilia sp. H-1]|nr:hypothetical protein LP419_36630 [Massilia sp. H-1]